MTDEKSQNIAGPKDPVTEKAEKFFGIFQKEVKHWVKTFGLTDWDVYFKAIEPSPEEPVASVLSKLDERQAVFFFNPQWVIDNQPDSDFLVFPECNEHNMRKIAFHEVIHLVLAPLSTLAERRFVSETDIVDENERLTVMLTGVLFDKLENMPKIDLEKLKPGKLVDPLGNTWPPHEPASPMA